MHPAWKAIASFILRGRIPLLIGLLGLTAVMFIFREKEISQDFGKVVPQDDPEFIAYQKFKAEFGEDGNVIVIGVSGDLFELSFFNGVYELTERLEAVEGITNVISFTNPIIVSRNDEEERFDLAPAFPQKPKSQTELDSIANIIKSLEFYKDLIIDSTYENAVLAVAIKREVLDSRNKIKLYHQIEDLGTEFEQKYNTDLKYAGIPVLRIHTAEEIPKELLLFLFLALIVTALTLFFFFRSLYVTLSPLLIVIFVVIWSLGILGLCGYKITLLTGIVPALITVIGIPNSVYLITKYHIEYKRTRNKIKSLVLVIEKIGIVTVLTNATTAVGLGVLAFTNIDILKEFGVVAGLSVVSAFLISILLIPILFSFLPSPSDRQIRHLDRRLLQFVIKSLDNLVQNHRPYVYLFTAILLGLSIWGGSKLTPVSKMADDISKDGQILKDLRFMENTFNGVMPFEILIDTGRKKGVQRRSNLVRIKKLQDKLKAYPDISKTISVADLAMFVRQAYFDGGKEEYGLPSGGEFTFIADYLKNTTINADGLSKTLTDSVQQVARISGNIKDIGSLEMSRILDSIENDVMEIFDTTKYKVQLTGTTKIYTKGNEYLIENLISSLAIAFLVVGIIIGLLFRSLRITIISLLPNFLPLLIVAGIMGFFNIPLKPSTALVFSVSFGIAVDDSIHFLARFRQALKSGLSVEKSISATFEDTGVSMIYTSIILYVGFVMFTASSFGGTQSLGILTSLTLLIAMLSNLLLLPSLLITFRKQ